MPEPEQSRCFRLSCLGPANSKFGHRPPRFSGHSQNYPETAVSKAAVTESLHGHPTADSSSRIAVATRPSVFKIGIGDWLFPEASSRSR